MPTEKPVRSFGALLRETIGDRLAPNVTDFLSMCAEDVVFEFPYAPEGSVRRLDGKAALAAYLPRTNGLIRFNDLTITGVHRSTDPDVAILEFEVKGAGVATGLPYDQSYVSVVRTRDGRIIHYRDYWNPLVLLAAAGGADALRAALTGGAS